MIVRVSGAWFVACLLGLAVAACGGSDEAATGDPTTDKLAQILERGTLVAYFEHDYAPQSFVVRGAERQKGTKCADNQLTSAETAGFDNDVTTLVAERLGVEACFVAPSWTEVIAGNWDDRWDIVYGSGSINTDRMQRLYMTQPYYAVPNRYFVPEGSPAREPGDLDGKRIGACTGCSHELFLRGELEVPGAETVLDVNNPTVVTYWTESPGLTAAEKGEIDAFLAADPVGNTHIEKGGALRPLDAVSFTYYPSGFVDKSSGLSATAFVERVNEIVRELHEDGTLRELSEKWFGADYASGAADFDIDTLQQEVQ